ncbi:NUDIX hydrolase domain-like protein [Blastocladiella britannica]|nr:NUDIX hydrolase domain-like protein [Blastocladiella britannica]
MSTTKAIAAALRRPRPISASAVSWKYKVTPPREAAVVLPLFRPLVANQPNQPLHVLFTVRSSSLRSHHGEIAFPGGMRDPTDASLYAAAVREVHEELGLRISPLEDAPCVLGTLTPLPDKSLTKSVHAFVVDLGDLDLATSVQPGPDEVAAVFSLPLTYLTDPANVRSYPPAPLDASPKTRLISMGRRTYWPVPADTDMWMPDAQGMVKRVSKAELVRLITGGGGNAFDDAGSDDLDVWGLTAFFLKEFVSVVK